MRLRGEQKFSSLEKLQEQLKEDARMAQGLLLAQEGEGTWEKK